MQVTSGNDTYILLPDMLGRGETARVFPAYLEGQGAAQAEWAVKLARDLRHNAYVEREYEALTALHGVAASPALPRVKLGASPDGRRALIMEPLLRRSLLAAFESLEDAVARERLALRAARQYAELLQTLVAADMSCRDRKLSDLWWADDPEAGQLIVTDWNVVDGAANQMMDLRRFGLLWFELLVGNQMLRDFQPRREDFDWVQDKVSYGLWHLVGRAVGDSLGPRLLTVQELVDGLEALAAFYEEAPPVLIEQAQADLQAAQTDRDRARADLAWMRFDLAQRRGGGEQRANIEQARLWAQDPFSQAAPDLLGKLASSRFTEVAPQLRRLQDKAQGPQELGDIARLQLGFDLLNAAMGAWQEAAPATELAQASQSFDRLQNLLVEGVLRPLQEKNGALARLGLQEIGQLLQPHLDLASCEFLEHEATFWECYQAGLKNLDEQPSLALEALQKARRRRDWVAHWPTSYQPTAGEIERLEEVAASHRLAALRQEEGAGQGRAAAHDAFGALLREDLAKQRWREAAAELVAVWTHNPGDDGLEAVLESTLEELSRQRVELGRGRTTPGRLAAQIRLIEALLQIPPGLAPDLLKEETLHQELADLRRMEAAIALEQKELFRNPDRVLQAALEGEYELFDVAALSAATLKAVRDFGLWQDGQVEREIDQLQARAEHLERLTGVLDARKRELEDAASSCEAWQREAPGQAETFFAQTLRLYLGAAQACLDRGESAQAALDKVARLLASGCARQALPPDEYGVYEDLYRHLVEMQPSGGHVLQAQPATLEPLEQVEP